MRLFFLTASSNHQALPAPSLILRISNIISCNTHSSIKRGGHVSCPLCCTEKSSSTTCPRRAYVASGNVPSANVAPMSQISVAVSARLLVQPATSCKIFVVCFFYKNHLLVTFSLLIYDPLIIFIIFLYQNEM